MNFVGHDGGLRQQSIAPVQIIEETAADLAEYASVSIAFYVREQLVVECVNQGLGGLVLRLEPVVAPYVKDYDAAPGHHPTAWASRFDMGQWGVLSAMVDGKRVGGAVVAWNTPGVDMLAGREDLAVLWDLRVAPGMWGRGVGTALFRHATRWAESRGARWLKVETQNINVSACRFYARHGCVLGSVDQFAYPAQPDEAQLCWRKELVTESA